MAIAGIGVYSNISIAIGTVHRLDQDNPRIEQSHIPVSAIADEQARFRSAVQTAIAQLRRIREQIPTDTPSDIIDFINTHLLMTEDRAIAEAPLSLIAEHLFSAEYALQCRRDELVEIFEAMPDPYLRTRKDDLDHVINRIQKALRGVEDPVFGQLAGHLILARDLTPADIVLLHNQGIAGFITEYGGPMSHSAILARSLDIPAVIGCHGATRLIREGQQLVLDAGSGEVHVDCDETAIEHFRKQRQQAIQRRFALKALRNRPARTRDGVDIELQANIELPHDTAGALENGAASIGLYRTEFLYMNHDSLPSEEEHFQAYRDIIEQMEGRPVTIRTLDLGADKQVDSCNLGAPCHNPAMGLRAIRLCLREPGLFRPQLKALLRASALGPLRIMLPMLTNAGEAEQTRAIIHELMEELTREGRAFDPGVPIGGMIETPAAALVSPWLARHLDFLSIGTNDLIQYTLAIDRLDDSINHLYDPLHPAVLRLIHLITEAAHTHRIPLSMCGEMASNPRFIPLLIGMGLERLSMQANALLPAKEIIRALDASRIRTRIRAILPQLDQGDVDLNSLLDELQP